MHDADQLFSCAGRLALVGGFDHLFADMVLDDLGDEAVHRAAAGGGLLKQLRAGRILLD